MPLVHSMDSLRNIALMKVTKPPWLSCFFFFNLFIALCTIVPPLSLTLLPLGCSALQVVDKCSRVSLRRNSLPFHGQKKADVAVIAAGITVSTVPVLQRLQLNVGFVELFYPAGCVR